MSAAAEFTSVVGNFAEWAAVILSLIALSFAAFAWHYSKTGHQHALDRAERERRALGPFLIVLPITPIALISIEDAKPCWVGHFEGIGIVFSPDVDSHYLRDLTDDKLASRVQWMARNRIATQRFIDQKNGILLLIKNANGECDIRALRCYEEIGLEELNILPINEFSTLTMETVNGENHWLLQIPDRYVHGLGIDIIVKVESTAGFRDEQKYSLDYTRNRGGQLFSAELLRTSPESIRKRRYDDWEPSRIH